MELSVAGEAVAGFDGVPLTAGTHIALLILCIIDAVGPTAEFQGLLIRDWRNVVVKIRYALQTPIAQWDIPGPNTVLVSGSIRRYSGNRSVPTLRMGTWSMPATVNRLSCV